MEIIRTPVPEISKPSEEFYLHLEDTELKPDKIMAVFYLLRQRRHLKFESLAFSDHGVIEKFMEGAKLWANGLDVRGPCQSGCISFLALPLDFSFSKMPALEDSGDGQVSGLPDTA